MGSVFRQMFVCCALIVLYSIDSTVSWSVASISDLGSDISAIDLPTVLYILQNNV